MVRATEFEPSSVVVRKVCVGLVVRAVKIELGILVYVRHMPRMRSEFNPFTANLIIFPYRTTLKVREGHGEHLTIVDELT